MGPVSGWLWLAGAGVAVAAGCCPGHEQEHVSLFWGIVALTVAYALACVTRVIPWKRVSLGGHAIAVADPAAGGRAPRLWLTGGSGLLHGPDARAADALRRVLLPAELRVAADGARGAHGRVPARHRRDGRAPAARRAARSATPSPTRASWPRSSSSSAAWSPPSATSTAWRASTRSRASTNRRGFDEALSRRAGHRRALHAAARRRRLLQADQRPLRPHDRRPRPARARRPHLRRGPHAAIAWPASAATSSPSSPRAPARTPPAASPTALRDAGAQRRLRRRPALPDRLPRRLPRGRHGPLHPHALPRPRAPRPKDARRLNAT